MHRSLFTFIAVSAVALAMTTPLAFGGDSWRPPGFDRGKKTGWQKHNCRSEHGELLPPGWCKSGKHKWDGDKRSDTRRLEDYRRWSDDDRRRWEEYKRWRRWEEYRRSQDDRDALSGALRDLIFPGN